MSLNFKKIKKVSSLPRGEKKEALKKYFRNNYQYFTKYFNNYKYLPSFSKKSANLDLNTPMVSVLMPIYNHADLALSALESIINQTYKNIEIIILDDGSTDNLLELLKPYYEKYNFIRVYTQKNQKLPRALTHLHQFTKGNFITWTSADNLMHKDNIKILVKELLKHPEASLVYGDIILIGENGKPYYKHSRDNERDRNHPKIVRLPREDIALSLESDNYINAAFLYRKQNSDLLKGIYADDFIGAEDYDYWLRLQKSGKLVHISHAIPLYYYRVHENTMSFDLQKQEKIKSHIMRINNLFEYEQLRKEYCNQRFFLDFSSKIKKTMRSQLEGIIKSLNYNSNILGHTKPQNKEIIIKFGMDNENADILIEEDYYVLKDKKEIVRDLIGYEISPLALKARNILSRNQFVYYLEEIKKPILGCHGDLSYIDITKTSILIQNNQNYHFVILDTKENKNLRKELEKYSNVIYIPNLNYGKEFRTYSNFSMIISLPTVNKDDKLFYESILLGYASGRNTLYDNNIKNLNYYPYTHPINFEKPIEITFKNVFNYDDYIVMDRYIKHLSKVESLIRIINFYKTYTQEKYIKRPDNEVEVISKSNPIEITFNDSYKLKER